MERACSCSLQPTGTVDMKLKLFFLLLFFSMQSTAGIVKHDWKEAGDQLVLLDTDKNLEWLNVSVSKGLSFNEVLASTGADQLFETFRVASLDEVVGLFGAYGIVLADPTPFSGFFLSAADSERLQLFIDDTGLEFYAYYDSVFEIEGLGQLVRSTLTVPEFLGPGEGYIGLDSGWVTTERFLSNGTWLVRDASSVSVPGSLGLFLTGLLVICRRRGV